MPRRHVMSEDSTQNTDPSGAGNGNTDAPEWARNAISKANNEAADFRVKLRAKTEEHTTALSQIESLTGEKSAAEARAEAAEKELLKYQIAADAKVPGDILADFTHRLQGATADELKADAEQLLSFYGTSGKRVPATDRSQGQGSDSTPGLSEGAAFLANALQGRFS